ncbi:MAG TPA: sigma-70 family RNA polymerase sigma factor [Polyangiales bacterium]|nr:sigma-70 family RNA polymerase sigma factor [Polyangiales bacterium]
MSSAPHPLRLVPKDAPLDPVAEPDMHGISGHAGAAGTGGTAGTVGTAGDAGVTGAQELEPEIDAATSVAVGSIPVAGAYMSEAQLFKRFAPYVARIGLRLLGREADVDDLIQEVFFAAFRQRDQLRDPQAAKNWLATIAVRTARRQLRRRRLRQFVGLDHGGPALELPDPQISPEKRALLARVYEILDSMGVERRLAWTLRYVEGEKLEVVAERCGCSLATVKRRIASAQALLLAEMEDG